MGAVGVGAMDTMDTVDMKVRMDAGRPLRLRGTCLDCPCEGLWMDTRERLGIRMRSGSPRSLRML